MQEIRRLLNEEREITAANLFLAHTRQTPNISWERRDISVAHISAETTLTLSRRLNKVRATKRFPLMQFAVNLACVIFTANCIKGNLFVARTLFNRLDKVSVVSADLQQMCWNSKAGAEFIIYDADRVDMAFLCKQMHQWATLMHLLAKEGHIDSVGVIYDKFSTSFAVPTQRH
jgi:hypothetical protein